MKTTAFLILSLLFIPLVYGQKTLLKKRTSVTTTYYDKGDDKIRHYTRTDNYIVYDKQGREIEYATYGEVSESYGKTEEGNAVIGDQWHYSNIFMSEFTTYDDKARILRLDTWLYHDNQKSILWDYSVFKYNDHDLPIKQITYTGKDSLKKTETKVYDKNLNLIEVIDSSYNEYPGVKLSILRTQNQFDVQNRLILITEFSDRKFLLRKKYLYTDNNVVELRYDKDSDSSLWCETETTYAGSKQSVNSDKPLEECWQTAETGYWTETDKIYFRNAEGLLLKIETYSKGALTGVTKFSYKYY